MATLLSAAPAAPSETDAPEASDNPVRYRYVGKVRIRVRQSVADRSASQESETEPTLGPEIPEARPSDTASEKFSTYPYSIPPPDTGFASSRAYAPRFGGFRETSFQEEVVRALQLPDPNNLTNIDWEFIKPRRQEGFSRSVQDGRVQWDLQGGVELEVDEAVIEARRLIYRDNPVEIIAIDDVDVRRGESRLTADRLRFRRLERYNLEEEFPLVPTAGDRPPPRVLVPSGFSEPESTARSNPFRVQGVDVDWHEKDLQLRAKSIDIDTARRRGRIHEFHGHSGPLYFGGDELRILGPADAQGEELWVTTCDLPEPHYRVKISRSQLQSGDRVALRGGQLRVGNSGTPLYIPTYSGTIGDEPRLRKGTRLRLGRRSELGSFADITQWFRVNDAVGVAPRFLISRRESVGVGFLADYDFMDRPASPLFRARGEFNTFITAEDRGATLWYHRQEFTPKTVLLGQWEQWYDEDFLKDFDYEDFEDRTGPRTFVNLTHTEPQLIATATVSPSTTNFVQESEKLPEGTLHLLDRPLRRRLYGSFDGYAGYYSTNPDSIDSVRVLAAGRLAHDWNLRPGINALPFIEADTTYYSHALPDKDDAIRLTATAGMTLQGRLQRTYPGVRGFSGFKHLILPSTTLSYRPDPTLATEDTPRFDDLDDRPGRLRIESTLDNLLLGRNASTGQIWPVARLTLYQGNDLDNEALRSSDYEVEMQIRPRPAWGINAIGEIHELEQSDTLPGEDIDRLLAFVFYDNLYGRNNLNARLGFALTEDGDNVVNQEIIYGLGYKLTQKWSVAFEHRFDFNENRLERQSYSLRRRLHKWELGIEVLSRRSGVDVRLEINLTDFPSIGFGV